MKLRKGLKVLNTPGMKYIAGVEYKKENVKSNFLSYFEQENTVVEEKEAVEVKEVFVPVVGAMTEEQLQTLNKDMLYILCTQYSIEYNKRETKDEVVSMILEAQEKLKEEDGDE